MSGCPGVRVIIRGPGPEGVPLLVPAQGDAQGMFGDVPGTFGERVSGAHVRPTACVVSVSFSVFAIVLARRGTRTGRAS